MSTGGTGTAPLPQKEPQESDLLVPFEIQNIPAEYREYYRIKRINLFASIQGFREMWRYCIRLDKIWLREFDDLNTVREPDRMFPLVLYCNAHAKIRISIELGFSGCLAEARSILRDAIEFVAHAHRMLDDSALQKTWLGRNDGKAAIAAFNDAFEHHKKERLFKGLDELHETYGQLSETGSHANLNAICDRFLQVTSADKMELRLNYCGVEKTTWALLLFSMLLTCFTMEQTMYGDYESRLKLDDGLRRMRKEFDMYKEQLRSKLKVQFKVNPPPSTSLIHRP